jgi:anti-anti-sigma regulatory factor/anti-sigma regulatory factor (Ser/Thr protein kinase)
MRGLASRAPTPTRGHLVEIEQSTRGGCTVLALHGRLDRLAAPRLQRVLRKRLAEQPDAVVCDLSGLDALDPDCAALFTVAAHHPSSSWPDTPLLLCGPRPTVAATLGRLGVPRFVPVHTTLHDALADAGRRPPHLRDEVLLAPTPVAPATARRFVRETCQTWRVLLDDDGDAAARAAAAELVDRAELVASELVTNALVHTRTDIRLRLALRDERLHIGVHDGGRRLLRLVGGDPQAEAGRGLLLVERLSRAWGVYRPPEGGKVVWCVLAPAEVR